MKAFSLSITLTCCKDSTDCEKFLYTFIAVLRSFRYFWFVNDHKIVYLPRVAKGHLAKIEYNISSLFNASFLYDVWRNVWEDRIKDTLNSIFYKWSRYLIGCSLKGIKIHEVFFKNHSLPAHTAIYRDFCYLI